MLDAVPALAPVTAVAIDPLLVRFPGTHVRRFEVKFIGLLLLFVQHKKIPARGGDKRGVRVFALGVFLYDIWPLFNLRSHPKR